MSYAWPVRSWSRRSSTPTLPISILTQPSSAPANATTFDRQLVAQLPDGRAGHLVTATLLSGDGTQSGGLQPGDGVLTGTAIAFSDDQGKVTFTNLGITGKIGDYTIRIASMGYTSKVSEIITLLAGAATQLALLQNPAGASSGAPFNTQPVLLVQDVSGNNVSQANVLITAAISSGTGTLGGAVEATTNGVGLGSYTNLQLTGSDGHVLAFTAPGLTGVLSGTLTVHSTTATALVIIQQPSNAIAGQPFGVPARLQLVTAPPPYTYAFTVDELLSDSGKWSTRPGATPISVVDGTAQATNPAQVSEGYVNATGLPTVSSNQRAWAILAAGTTGAFTVAARMNDDGTAYMLVGGLGDNTITLFRRHADLSLQWLGAVSHTFAPGDLMELDPDGSTLRPLINGVVAFEPVADFAPLTGGRPGLMVYGDAKVSFFGGGSLPTALAQAGVSVVATKASGSGTLSGLTPKDTDANGIVEFTNHQLSAVSVVTVTYSSSGLTSATSAPINVVSGTATQAVMINQPAGAVAGAACTMQPRLQLRDANGFPKLQAGVSFTATVESGGGTTIGTATVLTDGDGVAQWTNLGFNTTGPHVARFTAAEFSPDIIVDSASFTVAASAPPLDPSGLYPNKPGGLQDLTTLDFSQSVPPPHPQGWEVNIVGAPGWKVPFSGVHNMSVQSDSAAIISPPSVWQIRMAAGTYGSPTSGTGFGDFGYNIAAVHGFKSEFYVACSIKRDSNYEFHPNNEKWFEIDSAGLQMICVYWWGGDFLGLDVNDTAAGAAGIPQPTVYNLGSGSSAIGAWHRWEWHFKYGPPGTAFMHVWRNGSLLFSNSTTFKLPLNPGWQEMYFRNFRGGGGETKIRDSFVWYDHIHVAGKA